MSILGQTVANNLIREGHKGGVDTGGVNPLFSEEYGDAVEKRMLKTSFMRQYVKVKSIRGTDTVTNLRMGFSPIQKVTRGKRPDDHSPTFDNISMRADTMILSRANQFILDEFLASLDVRKEVGDEHGKEQGKFFDEAFITQTIKAAQVSSKTPDGEVHGGWEEAVLQDSAWAGTKPTTMSRTAPEGWKGGTCVILGSMGAELDPNELVAAIYAMCLNLEQKDGDMEEAVILLRPAQYYVLLENDKLMDKDFSTANGDYAKGQVLKVNGIRLHKTNRFPQASQVGQTHFLSNASNNNAYDVTANDAKCIACVVAPKTLLAGEVIPLTSNVHYSDVELQWFVDSYTSFAVTPNRPEVAAAIFSTDVSNS